MMRPFWVHCSLAFIGLLLCSCQSATPIVQLQEVTREVTVLAPQTVEIPVQETVEIPILVTVIVTATPLPTATNTPTPTTTPTLAVEIPADWKEYEHPTGEFTLRHPPEWRVEDQGVSSVVFRLPNRGTSLLGLVHEPPYFAVGEEDSINQLVREILAFKGEYNIEILAKGAWTVPLANFAESIATEKDYKESRFRWHELQARMPVNTACFIMASLARPGNVTDAEIESWKIMLASVNVNPVKQETISA